MDAIRRIDLKVGFRCNNLCRFCVQGDKRRRLPDRDTAHLKELMAQGREDADELVLTGGEATLRADLVELVSEARELGYRVIQLQTNGRMLCRAELLEALLEAGLTEVSPSVHGADASTHDALTRAPGAFRQTLAGIRRARRLGLPVLTNTVVTRANLHQLPALARLFVALDVQSFQLAFVHPIGSAAENFDELVPRLSEARPWLLEALGVGLAGGLRGMTEAVPLCFLTDARGFAAEWRIPRTCIFDAEHTIEDYTRFRLNEGKAKGPRCQDCVLDADCEGPWREYPARFGWGEFVPVARC